ncbi:MAG: ATP-dependent RNA helicase HrpA [Gammaproteobacteria bacterium]|nr:ATP-dependent RNA helicase HrpA [Pseudomonadales bacterium]
MNKLSSAGDTLVSELENAISECALSDRHRFLRELHSLGREKRDAESRQAKLSQLQKAIERSQEKCRSRWQQVPARIELPESLPVSTRAAEIIELIRNHQVIVVAGETGSGKTTQLPKLCLKAGLGRYGLIGHTQPRRLAAISVANRIAEELGTEIGSGVGYQIRFSDQTGDSSYLKLMTDGILLNEIQRDRFLNSYEVLIIDEAHERSLNIDFILGFLKQLLPRRPDLKVIITSATIDVEKFAAHFNGAPIISVSGRTYPVEIVYAPVDGQNEQRDGVDDDLQGEAVISALREIERLDRRRTGPGDVLVFFSSEKEIRETALRIRKQQFRDTEVLPLYARLRQADQVKIFRPHSGRRIILATNIAETSLTVPGIRYVIDTGLARISRYSVHSKIQRLPIEPVSQASARQRAGRCGRVAEGVCIRLYSEADFQSRPAFTDPEIKRTNLAAVILQMLYLRLGEVSEFPFIEPPENKAVNDGYKLLFELGAIDARQQLTEIGRTMARLPVDPRLARMLIAAGRNGSLNEVAVIVSALSIQDPRETPADKRQAAREKHAAFDHPESDFLSLVKLWDRYETQRQELSQSRLRKYCAQNFLSFIRMREWRETHRQLLGLCHQLKMNLNRSEGSYRDVHTALLVGSLNQVGCRTEGSEYLGSRNRKFRLLPSSALASRPPKWIVSGEIFETAQAYSASAARVEPEWIETVAGHLVRRSWTQPHWSRKQQRVMAYEKITLYGLAIIEKRQVSYGDIDPTTCRELFIRDGLVDQQLETDLPFARHNRQLRLNLEKQEEKVRKQAVFLDERRLQEFYDSRLPEWVIDRASLIRWYRKAQKTNSELLKMQLEDLLPDTDREALKRDFPDRATLHNNPLSVNYQFRPGSDADGATIDVPAPLIGQLTQRDLDWAIPGQLRERSIQLLKTLPKAVRKHLIPIPDFVDRALEGLDPGRQDTELRTVLCEQARRLKGVEIGPELLALGDVPEYLKVKIRVTDSAGKILESGSDLVELQKKLSGDSRIRATLKTENRAAPHPLEREGMTDWELDSLPEQVEVGQQLKLIRFPALVDDLESVSVRLYEDRRRAVRQTRRGLVRLFRLRTAQQARDLSREFLKQQRAWGLRLPPLLSGKEVAEAFVFAVYSQCFEVRSSLPRDAAGFEKQLQDHKASLYEVAGQLTGVLGKLIERYFALRQALKGLERNNAHLFNEIESQLENLLDDEFLYTVPFEWLREFPRYLQAIDYRLERAGQKERDEELAGELSPYWERLLRLDRKGYSSLNAFVEDSEELLSFRWMIEEFRVSLFAQQLRTRIPVSAKRLDRLWQQINASGH